MHYISRDVQTTPMYVGGKYSSLIVETFNVIVTVTIRPSSFFFRLALSAFPDIGSVGRSG